MNYIEYHIRSRYSRHLVKGKVNDSRGRTQARKKTNAIRRRCLKRVTRGCNLDPDPERDIYVCQKKKRNYEQEEARGKKKYTNEETSMKPQNKKTTHARAWCIEFAFKAQVPLSEPSRPTTTTTNQTLDRVMFELVPRLQDRRMHFLHRVAQLDTKPTQNVPLPRIILGVHPRLHLFVINDADAKTALRLRRIKRRARFLNLGEELLPVRKRVSKSIEDVLGFEVPERLELQPFGDVVFQLLDLEFDEGKWTL